MGNKITRRRPVIDERFTRPQGLYPHRDVDQRKLRRLIVEAKLAPCFPGAEEPATDLEECPICFLHYPSLNRSKCCTKGICTECYLQMKSPHCARPTQCPFCKTPNYDVEYRGAKTMEEKGMEQAEEQKVIEAKIRMRNQEQLDDEERKLRREEDIRAGRIRVQPPRMQPVSNHQIAVTNSAPLERRDPFSLWEEDYQRTNAAAPCQQRTAAVASNTSSPLRQQQIDMGFPTPQAPPGATRGRHREDEFDIDLEDIMVMEAIWLSIQEQEARHRFSEGEATRSRPSEPMTEISLGAEADDDPTIVPLPPPPGHEEDLWERQGLAPGGFAGAIAALAELQAVGGDASAQTTRPSHLPEGSRVMQVSSAIEEGMESNNDITGADSEMPISAPSERDDLHVMPSLSGRSGEEDEEDAENPSRASEKLANWVSSSQNEYNNGSSTWLGDQSSERVEVGTSFSSSVPSASELPWEAPENNGGESSHGPNNNDKVLVPDSFEEQMMLAMALSLADAQAHGRHGGNRSGPLPLSTNLEAQARGSDLGTAGPVLFLGLLTLDTESSSS